MVQSFDFMGDRVKTLGRQRIVVAAAHDDDVLRAVDRAFTLGICDPLLIGRQSDILKLLEKNHIAQDAYEIIDEPDDEQACRLAVDIVRAGDARALMKGLVGTAVILRAILDKNTGIRDRRLLSHIGLFFIPALGRPLIVTDAAMSIAPDLETKKHILENAVEAAHLLGIENPHVACVAALETVNPKMPATLDAEQLVAMNQQGLIRGCTVGGPLALDNALFLEAARHKNITDPVAGKADILLMPNIESGNVLYKAIAFLLESPGAGIVLGATAPVVLTSRSDHDDTKLHSIVLALYLAAQKGMNQ